MDSPNRCSSSTTQDQRPHHQKGVVGAIHRVARLRSKGLSWAQVCRELNISKGSAQRAAMSLACAGD